MVPAQTNSGLIKLALIPQGYAPHLLVTLVGDMPTEAGFRLERLLNAMRKEPSGRIELLPGTQDMLTLRTLLLAPAHGHQIAKHIQRTTDDLLQVEHGSLYPALHQLERKSWIASKWEAAAKDQRREFKCCRVAPAGRKQLTGAIARIMLPAQEGN